MRRVFLMALPLLLTACEGGGDPVNQAVREASARYQAEAVKEGTVSGPLPTASPTAPSETPEQAAIRQMIARNDEAITAARQVLSTSQDLRLRSYAEQTIASREQENLELRRGLTTTAGEPVPL